MRLCGRRHARRADTRSRRVGHRGGGCAPRRARGGESRHHAHRRTWRGTRGLRLAGRGAQGFPLMGWRRVLASAAAVAAVALAWFLFGRSGADDGDANSAAVTPLDPGYAARDAEVIETGYDGRERYRLKASVIRQQTESGVINLENLEMDYHAGAQARLPGEAPAPAAAVGEVWHLTSDRGQVRADGDDVQLNGNVRVTGPAPGTGEPLSLTTEE